MKEYVSTLFFQVFILITNSLIAQSLGQDSEGFSTLITPSFNIYLDASNDIFSLTYYQELTNKNLPKDEESEAAVFKKYKWDNRNVQKIITDLRTTWENNRKGYRNKAHRDIWLGLDIKGSSSNGIAPIFSDDRLASSASILGFVGYSWKSTHFNRKLTKGDCKVKGSCKELNDYISEAINEGYTSEGKLKENEISLELNRLTTLGFFNTDEKTFFLQLTDKEKKYDENLIKAKISAVDQRIKTVSNLSNTIKEINKIEKRTTLIKELFEITNEVIAGKENEKAKKSKELSSLANSNSDQAKKLKMEIASLGTEIKKLKATMKNNHNLNYKWTEEDLREAYAKQFFELEKEIKAISKTYFKLKLKFPEADRTSFQPWKNYIELVKNENDKLKYLKSRSNSKSEDAYDNLKTLYTDLLKVAQRDPKEKRLQKRFFSKTLMYGRTGFIGSSFTLDLNNGGETISSRFESVNFQSYNIEVGLNHQFKNRNYLGLSGAISYNHNLSGLKERTFTLEKVDPTIGDGEFSTSQEIKAFTGQYDKFVRWDVNADYVRLVSIKESKNSEKLSHLFLSLNPYLRHRIYQDADVLIRNTILGFGAHAYNSKDDKLMGGIFIQTEDLFGVHKDDEGVLNKGVNVGLVVKYNFKGLKPEKDTK